MKIIVGVPGLWTERSNIVTSIASKSEGYIFAGNILYNTKTEESFILEIDDYDPNLMKAFEIAGNGKLSKSKLKQINNHSYIVYIIGEGGSIQAVSRMMDATLGILKAGGIAVKIETTGVVHDATSWKKYCEQKGIFDLLRSFVTFIGGDDEYYSCGMHNFGLPDAIVSGATSSDEAGQLLQSFLLYMLIENPEFNSGETFSISDDSPYYQLLFEDCKLYPSDHQFFNQYGMWKLLRL